MRFGKEEPQSYVFVFQEGETFLDILSSDLFHALKKAVETGHKGLRYIWSGPKEEYEMRVTEDLGFRAS